MLSQMRLVIKIRKSLKRVKDSQVNHCVIHRIIIPYIVFLLLLYFYGNRKMCIKTVRKL